MKKLICYLCVIVVIFSTLSVMCSCKYFNAGEAEQATTPLTGYWECTSVGSNNYKMTDEEIFNYFNKTVDELMSLEINENHTVKVSTYQATGTGKWDELEDGNINIQVGDVSIIAKQTGDILYVTDSSDMTFYLEKTEENANSNSQDSTGIVDINLNSDQTMRMSNFMSSGWFTIDNNYIYGRVFRNGYETTAFMALPFSDTSGEISFNSEASKLLEDGIWATYISTVDDTLYYISQNRTNKGKSIKSIKTDGTNIKELYTNECNYLQIYDNKLYFTDANNHFVSTQLDGTGMSEVIAKSVSSPYILGNWIVYCDETDGKSLHILNILENCDLKLTNSPVYNPIIDGSYLYFDVDSSEGLTQLNRIDLSSIKFDATKSDGNYLLEPVQIEKSEKNKINALYIDQSNIYGGSGAFVSKEKWKDLEESGREIEKHSYLSAKYNLLVDLDAEGIMTNLYLFSDSNSAKVAVPYIIQ